jgi:O-antigen ligase
VIDIHVSLPGGERDFSAKQLLDDFGSVVSSDVDDAGYLQDTRQWRLNWWETIWNYTVRGPYFWSGKGYGINLANDDGFQPDVVDQTLRSPHNSHITFLARSGVPGAILWIGLQFSWLGSMLAAFVKAKRSGKPRWAAFFAWLICYWVAFAVTASFDVFLENPMGAVPFWTVFGLGWGGCIVFSRQPSLDLNSLAQR